MPQNFRLPLRPVARVANHQIVGPANVGESVEILGGGIARGESGDQRQQRRVRGRNRRAQQDAAINPGRFLRGPRAAGAASAGGLLLGEDDGAVRLARFAQAHGDGVRGIGFEEMVDAARERRAVESMAQHLRSENVRHALDVVAGARVAFDPHAEGAQFFDPAPDLLARDADFLGDFGAADDDGRVFGEQRQQRVNAPVGGAREVCHSLRGHGVENRRILDRCAANKFRVPSGKGTVSGDAAYEWLLEIPGLGREIARLVESQAPTL